MHGFNINSCTADISLLLVTDDPNNAAAITEAANDAHDSTAEADTSKKPRQYIPWTQL